MARRCAFSPMSGLRGLPIILIASSRLWCTTQSARIRTRPVLWGRFFTHYASARALGAGRAPSPSELDTAIEVAERLPEIIANDTELGYWRSAFERESGPFSDAWAREVQNTRDALRVVGATGAAGAQRYKDMVNGLNLRDPLCRGSGMLTAVAAVALV